MQRTPPKVRTKEEEEEFQRQRAENLRPFIEYEEYEARKRKERRQYFKNMNARRTSQKEEEEPAKTNVKRLTGEFEASTSQKSPKSLPQPENEKNEKSRAEKAKNLKKKIMMQLSLTRNTKTEIKTEIQNGVQGLLDLVLEAEEKIKNLENEKSPLPLSENKEQKLSNTSIESRQIDYMKELKEKIEENTKILEEMRREQKLEKEKYNTRPNIEETSKEEAKMEEIQKVLEDNNKLIKENKEKLNEIKTSIQENQTKLEMRSYASVAATPSGGNLPRRPALHSIVVSSKDEMDTGQEIIDKIRETIKAKESGLKIENIRKAKDRKVIIGCHTEEGREKIKKKLKLAADKFVIEDAVNKKPLVILKHVQEDNTDEDIKMALKIQNMHMFKDLSEQDSTFEILFRKKTRNPQVSHVVARAAPLLWRRMTDEGHVHIDLQRVRVEDQSPLIQCSMCLGYGHSKRLCTEEMPKCSHCGGSHVKAKCDGWLANTVPTCTNCSHAKLEKAEHNAFSSQCPIRHKWDTLARATIDYK